jgi:endonuclease/exonuclease/phosphatase family metal-dependent hydrolase
MNKKHRIIFISLLLTPLIVSILIFGISELPIKSPTKIEFKFMTYNIHFGQGMDDLLNLERIAQNILVEDPDIIGLQEVDNGRITTQGVDMALWLANRLNMDYFYYPAENEHTLGCALLSRFPIKSAIGYMVPSISIQRVLIHGIITVNSTLELNVFVTHLGLIGWGEDMTAQVEFILEKTNTVSTSKILMGDFNLENDSVQIALIRTYLNDTTEGFPKPPTFPSLNIYDVPYENIDYIFATGYKDVIDSHVVTDFNPDINIPAEFGSDHLPVVSILTFP